MHHNDISGAWDDVLTLHRLGRLLDQPVGLLRVLIACNIAKLAAEAGTDLAVHGAIDDSSVATLQELAALPRVGHLADAVDLGGRFFSLACAFKVCRGDLKVGGTAADKVLDVNEILRPLNEWWDLVLVPVRMEASPQKLQAWETLKQQQHERVAKAKHGELEGIVAGLGGWTTRRMLSRLIGDLLLSILMTNCQSIENVQDESRVAHDVETLALAIALFHKDTGRWPARLDELAPRYVKEIPIDTFSLKPLVYKSSDAGYVLYSVGKDCADDGGDKDKDIVAKVEAAAPAGTRGD
jgi:hypothetical protein